MKKSKKQDMFTVERKGYSQREVEDYILKEIEKNEIIHSEQRARIEELLEEIDGLKKVVDDYKAKEDKIAEALIVASEKADKMTADIKLRYAMELDRLNLFRAKWTGAYNELKERYGFDGDALNMESVAISTKLEIERFLQRDFSLSKGEELSPQEETFRLETERLSSLSNGIEDLKNKLLDSIKKDNVASSITK